MAQLADLGWVLIPAFIAFMIALAFVSIVALVLVFCAWLVHTTKDPTNLEYVPPLLDALASCRPAVSLGLPRRRGRDGPPSPEREEGEPEKFPAEAT